MIDRGLRCRGERGRRSIGFEGGFHENVDHPIDRVIVPGSASWAIDDFYRRDIVEQKVMLIPEQS